MPNQDTVSVRSCDQMSAHGSRRPVNVYAYTSAPISATFCDVPK
jgi:hypothetical protein